METDYSKLAQEDFEKAVRDYAVYKSLGGVVSRRKHGELDTAAWRSFKLGELFNIKKGRRLTKGNIKPGDTAFISALDGNNGLRQRIAEEPRHPAGVITVNYNGNGVAEAFFQPEAFWASDDVNVLYPKNQITEAMALFVCAVIRLEKYRFSYGRKWNLERMKQSAVSLPANADGEPDWQFMERYISSLPFSSVFMADVPILRESGENRLTPTGLSPREPRSRG